MPTIWIIHRQARGRAALARLAAAGEEAVLGAPTDDLFASEEIPDVVVLGLGEDFETELEFVHRVSSRLAGCRWILLPEAGAESEAQRLFDTVDPEVLPFPPSPLALRRAIRAGAHRSRVDPLSARRRRDRIALRFTHWFGDLELPDLLRALDPHLAGVPVLIRGEPGTGRQLLARYIHAFGGGSKLGRGRFLQVSCHESWQTADLLGQIAELAPERRDVPWTIWLEDADNLQTPLQHQLQSWIDFGLPEPLAWAPAQRWILGAGDELADLDSGLIQALPGLSVRIPSLRERPQAVEPLVADTAMRWCEARGEHLRRFSRDAIELLQEYPWPGNLRELAAVVERTLAASGADPIRGDHLRFDEGPPYRPLLAPEDEEGISAQAVPAQREAVPSPRAEGEVARQVEVSDESRPESDLALRRLVSAVAHEVRNPLTSIRTFAGLLPDRFEDEEFRERFAELVTADVRRLEEVVNRLQQLAGESRGERKPVDLAGILEELLDEQREEIRARHLLVLRELDRHQPYALGDAQQLRTAFAGLIGKALQLVPQRGDVYVASRYHAAGLRGEPALRVLLRYRGSDRSAPASEASAVEGTSPGETALEFVMADELVRAQGGTFTIDDTDAQETVIVIDLPAPS
jgi:DNA-binding NtrC family response regulator